MKAKKGYYLHRKGSIGNVKYFKQLKQIAEYLNVPYNIAHNAYHWKHIIKAEYCINQSLTVNWHDYHQRRNPDYERYGHKNWIEQQDRLAQIERNIPIFDSISGINERKLKAYKNTYKLSEDEAKQQNLESVFPDSQIYIDTTKHLYLKKNNHYYLLSMF